ncbi:N-acetylmuramoyl-L-alanine amidase [Clostridium bowmanii]|uniref:N-acetylmuramoyl-L-alanine amidase n=1 Tax=Clostridium bowmanii TaxID=132925 RepID=UPI001C0C8963|nr:N-acetylmuramoyl-L-alanine amidase [Clostridium bowmanii]MBU3188153.1 N-acetylmuramoyl-L-alanine amidase [Clostridium bowmanii]MCA1072335.1 N-acetylmuramoyl-L-alanine amidase [Clostridium bowmanii]
MKNIFKAFIIMILSFALCIPMQIIVKATTYTDMGDKENVVVSKPWTVSFNKSLSSTTVNTTNIKVVGGDNKNIDINVKLANNNKNVIVSPAKEYDADTAYTLIVTNAVKSADGKPLPKEVRMNFNTESAVTKPSDFTVCIDPAQYYTENTGKNGAEAKDINLSTALKLGNILKTRGFKVIYTRDSDAVTWDKLNEDDAKATIAKNAKADVFLSINTNSYSSDTANGIETYYLSDASNNNKVLAGLMQTELIKATEASDRGIKAASNEENLQILKKTSCPAVVLELGFLSNPQEETLLTSEKYQNNAAKAIANGLMNYAGFANTDTSYDSIFEISSVADIIVNSEVGNIYTFPKTVQATMSNNVKKAVAVEWLQDSVSLTKAGTYTYEGIIKNYDEKINVTINVKVPAIKKYKIVLDPGHGGKDSGAVGPRGAQEKAIVLAISLKVGNILAKNGVEVTYTRTIDKTQSLQAKCDVSNNAKPDYFVSIHANSFISTVSGIETFYKSGSAAGQKLANAVQTELIKATGRVDRKVKTAGFYVLNNTNATAILVETSFISNPTEEKLLVTHAYQITVAKAISTGILKTLGITKIVY